MKKSSPRMSENSATPSSLRLYDKASRRKKAHKILAVLRDALGPDGYHLRCLDVGCAAGLISYHLASEYKEVVGLDSDPSALHLAPERENLRFVRGDALHLPFPSRSFDVVICAQVYEHVPDPAQLVSEIWRILAEDGLCFFSGPNKLTIMEAHYGLPFLHWLPSRLAALYLRATGRGDSYPEKPLTCRQLRHLLQQFVVQDYTIEMLRAPEHYACEEEIPLAGILRHVPRAVWGGLYALLPNYNWVLWKRKGR